MELCRDCGKPFTAIRRAPVVNGSCLHCVQTLAIPLRVLSEVRLPRAFFKKLSKRQGDLVFQKEKTKLSCQPPSSHHRRSDWDLPDIRVPRMVDINWDLGKNGLLPFVSVAVSDQLYNMTELLHRLLWDLLWVFESEAKAPDPHADLRARVAYGQITEAQWKATLHRRHCRSLRRAAAAAALRSLFESCLRAVSDARQATRLVEVDGAVRVAHAARMAFNGRVERLNALTMGKSQLRPIGDGWQLL